LQYRRSGSGESGQSKIFQVDDTVSGTTSSVIRTYDGLDNLLTETITGR
jgi:hypothetical protein